MADSVGLPLDQQASYTVIIDSILAATDLNTVTQRKIRDGLQKAVPYDITPQKDAIKALIMQRFDKYHAEQEAKAAAEAVARAAKKAKKQQMEEEMSKKAEAELIGANASSSTTPTAIKRKADSEEMDTTEPQSVSSPPPKKKVRKVEEMDADAVLAAKLQAEENARSRSTRGGNSRKAAPPPKKKAAKKKSKSKVNAEDDSDVEGSAPERKINRNSGFHKELILSAPLSELLGGVVKLSRPQATKKLWEYIKGNELQDPGDKRQIRCDELMRAVFKTDSINMFKMTKAMSQNMYNEED